MTIRRFFETLDSGESSKQQPKRPRLQSTSKDSTDSVDSITTSDDEEQQRPYLDLPSTTTTTTSQKRTRIDTKDEDGNNTTVRYLSEAEGSGSANNNEEGNVNDNDEQEDGEEVFDGLESSMPKPELSDYEAIQQAENSGKRKSSLYVDAFNLALDTVLEDESYLFDEEEHKIFEIYRKLDYQAQYLYVRLFLRKTSAWFRRNRLTYYYDISDMPAACESLQLPTVNFAESESTISFDDAINLLNLDELRILAKEAKVPYGNKSQMTSSLKKTCTSQSFISTDGQLLRMDGDGKKFSNGTDKYLRKLLNIIGPCIRLTSTTTTLFSRVHLVFYRSTEWTEKSLTTLILARIMKRNFPDYLVCRTANIFPTRTHLVDFENAIKQQSEVDEILESGPTTQEALQRVLDIADSVKDRWLLLCEEMMSKGTDIEEIYLRRFSAAWVYTRIVHKGLYPLGRFKNYQREREALKLLLKQRLFHPSRRGGWYQRLALIEEHYFHDDSVHNSKREWLRTALATCEAGLQDPDTHVIYHYELQKRITKLEKKLNIVKREQHVWLFTLQKPSSRTIIGDRIINENDQPKVGQKTMWKLEGGEEVSVEEMCLDAYRKEGWKGFHCEGGIVRTIFAYLFYDILFLPVPNVFQTAFQTCPLDLHTDSFYAARASEINHRLAAISNGDGCQFVRDVHKRECERKTYVVGLDWEYSLDDILEILECLGGEALMIICKVLCQEYKERGSGMPDLFLWDFKERKKAKFAEVKSENDRLSDTQRVWIDVLTGAGVEAELCLAVDRRNVKEKETTKKK